MNKKTIIVLIIVLVFGINLGAWIKQQCFISRALEIPEKDTFTNQDIEHILYNTPLNP